VAEVTATGAGGGNHKAEVLAYVNWLTRDSRRLFVLVVREPDGEIPGISQMKSGRPQTGGWDLQQIQRYWERMGVSDAILLDGGDSTKLAYRRSDGGYTQVTPAIYSRAH